MHTAYMIHRRRYDFDQFVLVSHFQRKLRPEIPYMVFLGTTPYQKESTLKTNSPFKKQLFSVKSRSL